MRIFIAKPQTLRIRNVSQAATAATNAMHCDLKGEGSVNCQATATAKSKTENASQFHLLTASHAIAGRSDFE